MLVILYNLAKNTFYNTR